MIANYHTHTPRCQHAEGTEEAYIQNALERGLKILGFSDHTPYWYPDGFCSRIRMRPEELADYTDTLRSLQSKYASRLEIQIGLEAEYFPALFDDLLLQLRDQGIAYLLLGQHWTEDERTSPYNGRPTEDEALLRQYCDRGIQAMETGLFTYFAHPDVFRFVGSPAIYDRHMLRLCRAARDTDTPLEINLLGLQAGRHYPNPRFWGLAAEAGCQVILGSDAHRPQDVTVPAAEAKALQLLEAVGLRPMETVTLKKL